MTIQKKRFSSDRKIGIIFMGTMSGRTNEYTDKVGFL